MISEHHNIIDALLTGAGQTLKICGYLIANLIAFISVLHFADTTISWFFNLIHHPEINFQFLLGLIFYPFAMIIGIPIRDCLFASKLIGIKISLNEVRIFHLKLSILFIEKFSLLRIKNWVKSVNYEMN